MTVAQRFRNLLDVLPQPVLLADQCLSSLSNLIVLFLAARTLDAHGLSAYALFQALALAAMTIQRSVVLAPALAAQRNTGRSVIPLRWMPASVAACSGLITPFILIACLTDGGGPKWVVTAVGTTLAILSQDYLRYRFMSDGHLVPALISDAIWLAVTSAVLVRFIASPHPTTPSQISLAWCAGALCALIPLIRRTSLPSSIRFPQVWTIGRWAGVDALLTTFVTIGPLFISAIALQSTLPGTYRSMQALTSPLNLINTSMVLNFGLAAWNMTSREALVALDHRVRRSYRVLLPLAVATLVFSPLGLVIFGLPVTAENLRVGAIVGLGAILGAWVSPKTAAAQALGYQRYGAAIRMVLVGLSALITIFALRGISWVTFDPVGWTIIVTGLAAAIGWEIAYRSAKVRELRRY